MNDAMPPITPGAEERQRRDLRRSRGIATGLLVAMAGALLATHLVEEPNFLVLLLRAGTEAAMVGGLADWFAVTALFRHPFGIPIPHTALIPRNKDRIGVGLGSFVERHFLDPAEVGRKVREIDVAGRFSTWLAEPANARALARRLAAGVPYLLRAIEDREVRAFFQRALHQQLHRLDIAPVLGKTLEVLIESDHHHRLFDRILALAGEMVDTYEPRVREAVTNRSAWWMPSAVDTHIAEVILGAVREILDRLAEPDGAARARLTDMARQLIVNLQHSPEHRARVAEIKAQVLASPVVQDYLGVVWDEVKALVLAEVAKPRSGLERALSGGIAALGRGLLEDTSMRGRLNRRIEVFVVTFVVPWRSEIGAFIADVVRRWDGGTVAARVELEVGRDLQYIRINGTLVGALVGCILFLLSHTAAP